MQEDEGNTDKQTATKELLAVTSWQGGKVSFRCTGVDCDDETALAVTEVLDELASGWHMASIWFVGVLKSRDGLQTEMAENIGADEPVGFGCEYPDGRRKYIRTRVKGSEAVASFSDAVFGTAYSKFFVLSIFSHWEDAIRPRIVSVLGVPFQEAESDLMGEWRLLRNWLVHPAPGGDAEQQYFSRAKTLQRLLGSERGKPEVTVGGAFLLIEQLNTMRITVNPLRQEPLVQFAKPDAETESKIREQLGPNDRIISW